jgi:hypothetical protein
VASAFLGSVEASIVPRHDDAGRDSSSVPGGCIGSYSSVASVPESWSIIFEPPGWDGRKEVTS